MRQWIGVPLEEGGGGMNVDRLALYERLVALLWVLLGCVREKATANSFSDFVEVFARRHYIQLVPNNSVNLTD
jgi:hypothetical protein